MFKNKISSLSILVIELEVVRAIIPIPQPLPLFDCSMLFTITLILPANALKRNGRVYAQPGTYEPTATLAPKPQLVGRLNQKLPLWDTTGPFH